MLKTSQSFTCRLCHWHQIASSEVLNQAKNKPQIFWMADGQLLQFPKNFSLDLISSKTTKNNDHHLQGKWNLDNVVAWHLRSQPIEF